MGHSMSSSISPSRERDLEVRPLGLTTGGASVWIVVRTGPPAGARANLFLSSSSALSVRHWRTSVYFPHLGSSEQQDCPRKMP